MFQQMCSKFFSTTPSLSLFLIRIGLGLMILPHGLQKTLGYFGGHGFSATMHMFTNDMGIPWIFALAAILAEALGGLGLIFGAFTRLAAFGVGANMVVALGMIHWKHGWFMNWFGNQQGEGAEFFVLAISMALALVLGGGGKWSLDHAWQTCKQNRVIGNGQAL